jgi:hypothetical protein
MPGPDISSSRPARRFGSTLIALVTAASALLVCGTVAHAADLDLRGEATLVATAEGGAAGGEARLRDVVRPGGERGRVRIAVNSLDVTRDKNGNPPLYYAVLIAPGGPTAFLGELRVTRRGNGRLRVRRVDKRLPDAFPSLRDFEGGTMEVRRGEDVIVSAVVPRLASSRAGVGASGERVFGRFESSDAFLSSGTWQLRVQRSEDGEVRNRIAVVASDLANLSYRVFLISPANVTVDVGAIERDSDDGGLFRDSRSGAITGVTDLSAFGGGRIEVRRGSVVSLRAPIPLFRGVDDPPIAQRSTYANGTEQLSPQDADPAAQGLLSARLDILPARRRRRIRACFVGLDPSRSPFTVAVTWTTGTRTVLGTFDARGEAGSAFVTLQRDVTFGEMLEMSESAVEVLDRTGATALTGTFPYLD